MYLGVLLKIAQVNSRVLGMKCEKSNENEEHSKMNNPICYLVSKFIQFAVYLQNLQFIIVCKVVFLFNLCCPVHVHY